jgi:RNA exonuclease 1
LKWQKAVAASQANSRFSNAFDFDKYKKKDEERKTGYPADWVKAKKFGDWCKGNPHAIAIDCEMCKTCDPVTGAEDHKALCRLSVVNACDTSDVLIDTLVKPAWPVTDYRSWVNGIKKDDLQSVQFTLRHAQAFMLALCSEETVIIGHSVENDLVALKMEHYTIADSAFLFNVKDEERNSTPSLKDCAYHILKRDMPDTHDSVNDARVSLMCIEEGWIQKKNKGEDIDDIPRTFSRKKRTGSRKRDDGGNSNSQEYANSLFVHRIPTSLSEEHISNLFVHMTSVQPKDVPDIDFGADYGKTTVAFSSEVHAKLAFESLKGDAKPDKTGRLQKRIYLKKGGYVQVRKMVNQ